jgi:DNA repair exonuclease SbcCD ATPase subunit
MIYKLQEKEIRRAKEEKRRREKKIKRRQDALKSAIKRLKPGVEINSTWEEHASAITALEEYHELADEELAKEVFDKYIHRLKVRYMRASSARLFTLTKLNYRKNPKRSA